MSLQFTPYLNFNGNCREAFALYNRVFGGEIEFLQTFRDSPMAAHVPPEAADQVMHACLNIGGQKLMGSDAAGQPYSRPQGQYVSIQLTDPEQAERLYQALVEGGTVEMELQETFWAKRFAMFRDRFNTPWILNCEAAQAPA